MTESCSATTWSSSSSEPVRPDALVTRDSFEPDQDPDDLPPGPAGHLRLTTASSLVAAATVGIVGGWSVRLVFTYVGWVPPRVAWTQPLALALAAAILFATAWQTHRAFHRHQGQVRAHEAVNRLVLAKASALMAALAGGAYVGSALSWVNVSSEIAGERIVRSLVSALAAAVLLVAALLLERACRVEDPSEPT